MRVVLVTPWETACGIAEHSWYLKQAVEAADPTIEIVPDSDGLNPLAVPLHDADATLVPIVHLNYQAALHSRWSSARIAGLRGRGIRVVVTFHDTGVPNSDLCKAICGAADAAIVHEPFDDLPEPTRYWRMGVPSWQFPIHAPVPNTYRQWDWQPTLGSIGFPFGWKCYDELARITGEIGWALLLIAPGATAAQVATWRAHNPALYVRTDFVSRHEALSLLAGCDATAFTYVCHNTGQSGALLQGIAARKPVIALSTCRQFRALYADPLGHEAIRWCETFEEVAFALRTISIERCDPGIVALAEQDSWARLGRRYAALYQELSA